jgi:hypothetical protein
MKREHPFPVPMNVPPRSVTFYKLADKDRIKRTITLPALAIAEMFGLAFRAVRWDQPWPYDDNPLWDELED